MNSARILLIEDDLSIASALDEVLSTERYLVAHEQRGDFGLKRALADSFDLVLSDLKLPGMNGLELVRELHAARPRLPLILMTAHGTTETAIQATRCGAYDYLLKPFKMEELLSLVEKAVAHSQLKSVPVERNETISAHDSMVGRSRAMQSLYKEIGRVAGKPVDVLLRGETGTGKELVARAIYQHGNRAHGPFVPVNTAAIPEALLESELFGHERGAFTGANSRRIGRFEQAHGGTIFLDEIGEMSPGTQVKLLRVLQERCLSRVGGREVIPVDIRVIAATHCHLEKAIEERQFRQDLYYRLSDVTIVLPPLRCRLEDIPDLARYFIQRYESDFGAARVDVRPEALELLQSQSWPGNVRELEKVVRKALLLANGYAITAEHVEQALARRGAARPVRGLSLKEYVGELLESAQRGEAQGVYDQLFNEVERELFAQAIAQAQSNQAKAARWLGVSRLTMRDKLLQFGLHPGQGGAAPVP